MNKGMYLKFRKMFARRHFEVDLIQISRGSGKLATGGLLRQLIMSIFGMSPTKKPESTEADYLRIHGNGDEIGNFVRCCVLFKQGARGLVAESDGIWCTKLDSILHAIRSSADHVVSCSPNRIEREQDPLAIAAINTEKVNCLSVPNYQFALAVDMIKTLIERSASILGRWEDHIKVLRKDIFIIYFQHAVQYFGGAGQSW